MLVKTLSVDQLKDIFGDFTPYLNEEGTPSIFWEEEILTSIVLPAPLALAWNINIEVNKIRCHKKIAKSLLSALNDIHSNPQVWNTINDFGGVYQFRLQRKSKSFLSTHCWGIAIDLDVGDNPFGKKPSVHPKVVEIFVENGFIWGGFFPEGRKDGMHFEFNDQRKLT